VYVDDSVLTSKVKTEIFNDPMLKVLQINVESYKGVVQLSGFVDSSQAANRAVEVAKSVKGVQSVKNNLVVK
jgi:osmotically-inducible protein OsmY